MRTCTVALMVAALVAGCVDGEDESQPKDASAPWPDHDVTWSAERITSNAGTEMVEPLVCAPTDYPSLCPMLPTSQRVLIERIPDGRFAVTWWASSLGSLAVPTIAEADDVGCLWVDATSDNTGARHEFSICPDGDGYSGSIEWTLRAFAGRVRFSFVAD